jgi:adenine-specific DNA-methyltransferase
MARSKKSNKAPNDANAVDYRYPQEKRTNIPPGRIAGEGVVPKVPKVRYSYSPHLPPTLQFDTRGEPDKVNELIEKATRTPISAAEAAQLRGALQQHEPWLEWSGKQEKRWFEVDPVALHMHERVSTQAILRVAAREDVQRGLFADPQQEYAKAVQFYQHEVDWANRMILGDSLQVMTSLARREGLAGKVQMIYIDPPYGIKFASNFQTEIGKRDVKEQESDLTREPETIKAFRDTWNLGIHSYLSYLSTRFVLSRELLADSGSVFVQIGEKNLHRVRAILDEIFGQENFVAQIGIQKTGSAVGSFIQTNVDYLLWYAKNKAMAEGKFERLYKLRKVGGAGGSGYSWVQLANGSSRSIEDVDYSEDGELNNELKLWRSYPLTSDGFRQTTTVNFAFHGQVFHPGSNRHWGVKTSELARVGSSERLVVDENQISLMRYWDDAPVVPLPGYWSDLGGASGRVYVVQTNPTIVERCLLMTTKPGDLVLDPTCGSGTTAYVAEQWGRRWITCDSSRVALALAKHRLMTAMFDYCQLRPVDPEDLERNPNGTWLSDPMGTIPGKATFQCKMAAHITLKSIARNTALDPIFAKHEPILSQLLHRLNIEVAKVDRACKERLVAKLMQRHREKGGSSVTDADMRRWLLPDTPPKLINPMSARKSLKAITPSQAESYCTTIPKSVWQEWEVPFDCDVDWPQPLQDALTAYRVAWRAKLGEVNACIATNAEMEELVDKPEVVKGVLRVSGPFTVEGVRPEELNLNDGYLEGSPNEAEAGADLVAVQHQNLQAYLGQMVQLIRQDGLTFLNNKRRQFGQIDSLFDAATGSVLQAEGSWDDSASPDVLDVAIGFGPQYGPVTALQVEEMIHASKRHNELVVAGFSFDADATALIQEQLHPALRIHQAYIRPDVNPGMAGLLKETPDSQLFTVFGTPEIEIESRDEGNWVVQLKGVEIYDPVANTIASTGADKVAAWFLDSDFDGRCFCITQAFFPNQDSWEKIAKALGSAADANAFEAFKGTTSIPFSAGKYKRVAVKVIDPRGNEVMVVRAVEA